MRTGEPLGITYAKACKPALVKTRCKNFEPFNASPLLMGRMKRYSKQEEPMKLLLRTLLVAALVSGPFGLSAQAVRTDINPAMLYYQAFLSAPQLTEAEMDYLGTNYWGTQSLPHRYGELVARYDDEFKLVRQAARSTVPCDWGLDMTTWPRTLLPHLPRGKAVAVGARSRVVWELAQGKQADARDDLLSTLALARNISHDGTLIACLVQIAIESITTWNVAENFGRFTPETLEQIVAGIDAAPARGTLAAALTNEVALSHKWIVGTIEDLRKTYPGDDAKVMAALRELFKSMRGKSEGEPDPWDKFIQAAGGSSESILQMVRDSEPVYGKLLAALAIPLPQFESQEKSLAAEFENPSNPLLVSFPAILRARRREARSLVTFAMIRAAVEYKLHGAAALQTITDPAGTGPFAFRRFVFNGVDRGFQLTSVLDAGGFNETLVFVETPGPAFLVGGPHVGQARGK
jgi:hypothetical protein